MNGQLGSICLYVHWVGSNIPSAKYLYLVFGWYYEMCARHLNKNADDFEAACKSLDITER